MGGANRHEDRKTPGNEHIEGVSEERKREQTTTEGQAESPVDSMHVDAPKRQKNARGHRQIPQRDQYEG